MVLRRRRDEQMRRGVMRIGGVDARSQPWLASECDPNAEGCCLPLCDTAGANTCPGQGQTCEPYFEWLPEVLAGLETFRETLGYCVAL